MHSRSNFICLLVDLTWGSSTSGFFSFFLSLGPVLLEGTSEADVESKRELILRASLCLRTMSPGQQIVFASGQFFFLLQINLAPVQIVHQERHLASGLAVALIR